MNNKIFYVNIRSQIVLMLVAFGFVFGFVDFLKGGNYILSTLTFFCIFLMGIGIYFGLNHRIVVSDTDIDSIVLWPMKKVSIRWEDVKKISLSFFWLTGNTFVIFSRLNETIMINNTYRQYKDLVREVIKRVPKEAYIDPDIYEAIEPCKFSGSYLLKKTCSILALLFNSFALLFFGILVLFMIQMRTFNLISFLLMAIFLSAGIVLYRCSKPNKPNRG